MKAINRVPSSIGVVFGIFLYELADTFFYIIQPHIFPTLLRLIGAVIIIYNISRTRFNQLDASISNVFRLMFIWTLFMLLRGNLVGISLPGASGSLIDVVRDAFLKPYGALAYVLPFIALFKFNPRIFYYIKNISLILCVSSLLMVVLARDQIINGIISSGVTTLSGLDGEELTVRNLIGSIFPGLGIILLGLFCCGYFKSRYSFLLPISIFVFFICCAIGGGRGMTVFSLLYLLFFFYLMYRKPFTLNKGVLIPSVKSGKTKMRTIMLFSLFIIALVYLFSSTEVFDYVFQRAFGGKDLNGEFQNESRNILVNDMINDFNSHPFDWIWGRGINGSYVTSHLSINGRRAWMEYSYYYLILKGGLVYLFLFAYCLIHAVYQGFFKSNNYLSKCLAFMCVALLLNMLSAGAEPRCTTQFVLSWLCFGLLERKEVRMMSEKDIVGYFNNKYYSH